MERGAGRGRGRSGSSGRKRGRPSNAELRERAALQAAIERVGEAAAPEAAAAVATPPAHHVFNIQDFRVTAAEVGHLLSRPLPVPSPPLADTVSRYATAAPLYPAEAGEDVAMFVDSMWTNHRNVWSSLPLSASKLVTDDHDGKWVQRWQRRMASAAELAERRTQTQLQAPREWHNYLSGMRECAPWSRWPVRTVRCSVHRISLSRRGGESGSGTRHAGLMPMILV